jgi:hypothetical protein
MGTIVLKLGTSRQAIASTHSALEVRRANKKRPRIARI